MSRLGCILFQNGFRRMRAGNGKQRQVQGSSVPRPAGAVAPTIRLKPLTHPGSIDAADTGLDLLR
jgi:hypothetical protein